MPSSVTELRVHGVGGAAPDALLGTTAHRQVWGDRIAGFYAADAEQRGRNVEAYCWGGMTSRSSTRVLWVLLFPFMLANLAGWTCSARIRADRWAFAAHRACGRLAALGITLNLLLIAALAAIDVWAFQFGSRPLEKPALWEKVVHAPVGQPEAGPRVVIGAIVVVAVLVGLWLLSRQARHRYEEVTPADPDGQRYRGSAAALADGVADPQFFNGADTVRRLGLLHVGAGLAWLACVLAWLSDGPLGLGLEIGAAALLGCAILLLAVETGGERVVRPLVVAAALLACVAAAHVWQTDPGAGRDGHLAHMEGAAVETFWLIVALVVARLPVMATIVLLRRAGVRRGAAGTGVARSNPRWPAAPLIVAVLGMLSANIAGLGGLIGTAKSLGLPDEAVFDGLRRQVSWLTLAPLALGVVFLLVELIRYAAAGGRRGTSPVLAEYAGRMDATPAPAPPWDAWRCNALPVDGICGGERQRRMGWVRSIARARKVAGFAPDVRYLLAGLVAIAVVVLAGIQLEIGHMKPRLPTFANHLAVALAGLIPVAGVALLRWGWRRPAARRWLGVLWDVGTFWPRSFHPFAPPCYTERAVPDLQRRIRWLNDSGHRVVVVAHSQGSVLAALALAQQPDGQPALVTFGSPLMKLYGWAFPAYVHDGVLDRLRQWRNFSYPTDYIGGPVGRAGVDVPLPDPDTAWYTAGEPMPRMRRHTGYWSDEAMWQQIDRLATAPTPATTPKTEPDRLYS